MNKLLSFSLAAVLALTTFTGFTQSEELGLASYYGDKFHGSKTAYGDTYDRNKMTCAHKRHKYGTQLKVTRIDNKKSVVVKVTDRGPFVKGRVVDLSYAAAEKIGLIQDGIAEVKVEVLGSTSKKEDKPSTASTKSNDDKEEIVTTTVRPEDYDIQPRSSAPEADNDDTPSSEDKRKSDDPKPKDSGEASDQGPDNGAYPVGVYQLGSPGSEPQFAVQVASMSSHENALRQIDLLKKKWFKDVMLLAEPRGETVYYKVLMGPFESEDSAKKYKESLKKKHKMDGFVVGLPVESTTTIKGGEPSEYSMKQDKQRVVLESPKSGDYGVQVASLDNFDAAIKYVDGLKARWFKNIVLKVEEDKYKVILGPMEEESSAKNYMDNLAKKHKIKGFVVNLND
ncbi:MAG: septal ring lytic transglycosylase RlpA family protein [Bacteroidetes bacterium]|nr:MAG: septal ring lytic transglycosylase RlpA family protein [Bacteroidota bacterium]